LNLAHLPVRRQPVSGFPDTLLLARREASSADFVIEW
jgi:hypothetical protein